MAAAGRSRLRASHADREQVIEALKAAFVQERLTKDEFDERVGQALMSRTGAELAVLMADLPAGLMAALPRRPPPVRKPARKQVPMNTAVTAGGFLVVAANVAMMVALLSRQAAAVIVVSVVMLIGAVVAIRAMIVAR
jgi:hypothetical protein